MEKKAIARKKKPLDDQSKGFKVRGTPGVDLFSERVRRKGRVRKGTHICYIIETLKVCQDIVKKYIENTIYRFWLYRIHGFMEDFV